jgi:pimeloyl-ACP methyl ester carboxylesterase
MSKPKRKHGDDLRAATMLAVEATVGITRIVQEMHRTIASGPAMLGRPLARPATALTDLVYGRIARVTDAVGSGLDAALTRLGPLLGESTPGPEREAVLAALNGVLGDHLLARESPLAIRMAFRAKGRAFALDPKLVAEALPDAGSKLLVLLHGSSMTDLQWVRDGHDHAAALARAFGVTPVHLVYNSGLHISTNGRAFGALLDELVRAWPCDLEEISLVGHSMGGLVARSACHIADTRAKESELRWRPKLRRLACLGSPHHGSPLERGGSYVDALLDLSAYSAPLAKLGKIRSAGVTDLRFGNVADEDWQGRERFAFAADGRAHVPLPTNVATLAIAGTRATTASPDPEAASPALLAALAGLPGDGLVPVASALGLHAQPSRTLAFSERFIAAGTTHLDLLGRAGVYEKLRDFFARTT